jgi:hypothetical protein
MHQHNKAGGGLRDAHVLQSLVVIHQEGARFHLRYAC